MQIFENDYWNNYLKPYVADMGVALAFGVGCLLFKSAKKDSKLSKNVKESIKKILTKWNTAKTIQKFNSLIINNEDKNTDAFSILKSITEAEVVPDTTTYNCLIYMSLKLNQTENAMKLHEDLKDEISPVHPDIITYNILLKALVNDIRENFEVKYKLKLLVEKVNALRQEIKERGLNYDDFTYNTIIDAYVESGELSKAWEVYEEMKAEENEKTSKIEETKADNESTTTLSKVLKPDIYTYTTLIKGLKSDITNLKNFEKIMEIYYSIKLGKIDGIKLDEFLINSVLDACVKFNKISEAESIFKEMKELEISASVITYSIILKGHANHGKLEEATELFNKMKLNNIKPNEVIYDCLLNCAIKLQRIDIMKSIYENMTQDKIAPNSVIYSTIVKGFNRTKNYELAFSMFDSMSESQKQKTDIVFYNALLDCCIESNNQQKMNEIHELIKQKGNENESFAPTVITYSTLLKGYTKFNQEEKAIELYNNLINSEYFVDEVFFNTMADFYARQKNSQKALAVLNQMKEKKVIRSSVIYSILIKLFSLLEDEKRAISIFDEMKKDGLKPTLITYTTIMQMYIKQKKLDQAISVFYEMREAGLTIDVVSYNFIINGCSFNKKLEKAIEILNLSFSENIKLSENTYNNVLEYIMNNKFMKQNERCQYSGQILTKLKERNISVKHEIYSKVMKMLYQTNEYKGAAEVEKFNNFNKYNKFTNMKQEKKPREYKTYNDFTETEKSGTSIYTEKPKGRANGNGFNRSGKYNN